MNSKLQEEQSKKAKYDSLEHAKLIGPIIDRMGTNHTNWLIALITAFGFAFTIDAFMINLHNETIKIVVWSIASVVLLAVQIILLWMSRKYFILEQIYRSQQEKAFNGDYLTYELKPVGTPRKTWSWPFTWTTIIIVAYVIIQITIAAVLFN